MLTACWHCVRQFHLPILLLLSPPRNQRHLLFYRVSVCRERIRTDPTMSCEQIKYMCNEYTMFVLYPMFGPKPIVVFSYRVAPQEKDTQIDLTHPRNHMLYYTRSSHLNKMRVLVFLHRRTHTQTHSLIMRNHSNSEFHHTNEWKRNVGIHIHTAKKDVYNGFDSALGASQLEWGKMLGETFIVIH